MAIFGKKKNPKPAKASEAPEIIKQDLLTEDASVEDMDEITAVIMAAICACGHSSESRLVVRSIIRVPEQGTAWNRLQFNDNF